MKTKVKNVPSTEETKKYWKQHLLFPHQIRALEMIEQTRIGTLHFPCGMGKGIINGY